MGRVFATSRALGLPRTSWVSAKTVAHRWPSAQGRRAFLPWGSTDLTLRIRAAETGIGKSMDQQHATLADAPYQASSKVFGKKRDASLGGVWDVRDAGQGERAPAHLLDPARGLSVLRSLQRPSVPSASPDAGWLVMAALGYRPTHVRRLAWSTVPRDERLPG